MLNQGGHGIPPADNIYGPGPTIESVDSSSLDPADIAIPDDGADHDLEDGDFWTRWLADIKADEYPFYRGFHRAATTT